MSRLVVRTEIDASLPLFARRLKAARLEAAMSQERLGVEAGVDEFSASPRVNQYERGKHTPDPLTAKHLANVLNVPLAYFWAVEEDEALLLQRFHKLAAPERKQLLEFAMGLSNKLVV